VKTSNPSQAYLNLRSEERQPYLALHLKGFWSYPIPTHWRSATGGAPKRDGL